jgi:hypothetical protein
MIYTVYTVKFYKMWGTPPGGALFSFFGGGELFVLGTYLFRTKYGRKIKYLFWPTNVRKVCYSSPELYVRFVYLNLFGWTGRDFHEIF